MKIYSGWAAVAVGLAFLPVLLPSNYYLGIMIFIGLNALAAMGLCLLMGYAGQISLGHAAFFGLGAYTSGILSASYGLSPWLSMAIAVPATAGLAFALGVPILRLQGYYLAVATLGMGIIVYLVFMNWTSLTGGPSGLSSIPYLTLGPFTFNRDLKVYYLVWAMVFLALAGGRNIVNSRVGRALRSIHSSEIAAQAMGINTSRYKVKVFALSAGYAALAGGLYAHYLT
ncbi:MAG TPA: branched-chain amino acid ABC transporter permease, partial [bacterium]|nr:branched-chain amino acid ABC transporter permease [bacterium]